MCSRRALRVVAALVIAGASPGPVLEAQETDAYRQVVERLTQRVDTLRAVARAARGDTGIGPLDTVTTGAISLVVPSPLRAFAQEVGRAAWDSLVSYFGPDTSTLAPTVAALVPVGRRGPPHLPVFQLPRMPEPPTELALGFVLARVRDQQLARMDRGGWGQWFDWAVRLMLFGSGTLQAQAAYVDLATKPWVVVRECFVGDLGQCARLASVGPDDQVTDLYGADERRRIVERARRNFSPLRRSASGARCLDAGSDSACVEFLREYASWIGEDPLSPAARATLMRIALDLGGEGAFGRLAASRGQDVLARLASTAGVPSDTLLAAWRRRILDEKPPAPTLPRRSGWLAFAWVVVFALAASRSTRWRRG